MARRALALAALGVMLAAQPAGAADSITLDQPNPVYRQVVTFTATYPREATRKVGRQQQVNPAVQVDCSQAGVHVFTANNGFFNETHNADGSLTGHSGPVDLGAPGNENSWTGGAATCSAALYYFGKDELIHVLAEITFEVAA